MISSVSSGSEKVKLNLNYTSYYLNHLHNLLGIFCLKQLLYYAKLNDPYQGGLSSYGLILLIVSFLQWNMFEKKDISIYGNNVGTLFVDFLGFYSNLSYENIEIKPFNPNSNPNCFISFNIISII